MLCPVNTPFQLQKSIDISISILALTLTSPSDMLHVLKTGQAGTRSESLSDFIIGRFFTSGFLLGHATVDVGAVITERLFCNLR